MPQLPSLPEHAHLRDVFAAFPAGADAILALNDALVRAEGALSVAERELIAAHVSALNACRFCHGAHRIYAEAFGIEADVIDRVVANPETAPVRKALRALLVYAGKMNALPATLRQSDVDDVFAAGATEAELVETVKIVALFNMMNRIIDGTGVSFDYAGDDSTHPARRPGTDIARHSHSGIPMGGG